MTTSHVQKQSASVKTSVTSVYHAWQHWMPVWHGLCYVTLVSVTMLGLVAGSHSWWQKSAMLGLSLLLGAWYGFCIPDRAQRWLQNPLIAIGYFATGWALWFGLTLLDPVYLFMLCGLYPQVFIYIPTPWKIIGAFVLLTLCLWRQTTIIGGLDWTLLLTLGTAIAGTMLAVFIEAITRQSEERQHLIRELEATRQELAVAEPQAGIAEERQRLAREIHDTLAQGFTSIVIHLEAAQGALSPDLRMVQRHLDQVLRTARENLAEARRLLWALQPEELERASLPEVLTHLAERWSEESGVLARAAITGTATSLRPEVEVTFLRAAQEALANARKYAMASEVTMTLSYMDDVVVLDVQDDGVGFEPAQLFISPLEQASGSFGLKALRERVEHLGGTLSIESAPGEGTTIAVTLPALSSASLFSSEAASEVKG